MALVIVDAQNDFANENGSLSVPNANEIYKAIEQMVINVVRMKQQIFLTRDWHPDNHCSFDKNGGMWPSHCVQNTWGAEFTPELLDILNKHNAKYTIISKGQDKDFEEYSGAKYLCGLIDDWESIAVCGLATDYCVLQTALELRNYNFFVSIAFDACKHVFDKNLSNVIEKSIDNNIVLFKAIFDEK